MSKNYLVSLLLSLSVLLPACTDQKQTEDSATHKPDSIDKQSELYTLPDGSDENAVLTVTQKPWKGDLDGMIERGFIRILTVYNPLYFTYNGIEQRGLVVEAARLLEDQINKKFVSKKRHITVALIPVSRDKLIPYLNEGRGDIAAANLTITPARQKLVDFSDPFYTNVKEIVVSGPAAPGLRSFDDLSKTKVHVLQSSSYFQHLERLNLKRKSEKKPVIPVQKMNEHLEDYDLLDMVNTGIIPAIIVDSNRAALWRKVFDHIKVHEDLSINEGGSIAWAIRKESPKLLQTVNEFSRKHREGSPLGNILLKRYLGSTKWMNNVWSEKGRKKYEACIDIIRKYAKQYNFNWLMIVAQGYQESGLDQTQKSKAGAVGIMQVLPTTAADPNVGIKDIHQINNNVHAGVKYLRFLRSRYFDAAEISPLDRVLFSFAAYNAGPGNIRKARRKAKAMGFDPNQWFDHVEVAAAKSISREPVIYVRNILKYFISYKLLEEIRLKKKVSK
jgi:membrane-bound lytic murein transglycosylase MltF